MDIIRVGLIARLSFWNDGNHINKIPDDIIYDVNKIESGIK